MRPRKSRARCPRLNVTAYSGQWADLDPKTNRVVGHAVSLEDAERAGVEKCVAKPLHLPVLTSDGYFIGSGRLLCRIGKRGEQAKYANLGLPW